MVRKIRPWLYLVIAVLFLSACSKEEQGEKPDPLLPVDKEGTGDNVAPFTGVLMEEESMLRPVLATVNNHMLARPQSGLSAADLVYELVAEGNVTRLLAVFQSELPEEIGPIRSARDYFIEIAKGLDAFYVAHGYSPDAHALLQVGYVDHINGMQHDGTLFKRSPERKAPHNSFISKENILGAADSTNTSMEMDKLPSLSFHESLESAKIGEIAQSAIVQNGNHPDYTSNYSYDDVQGTYDRTVDGVLTVDTANEKKIELTNILVFEAVHETIDTEGRQAIDLDSGGDGLLFQAGVVREIEWRNVDGILTPMENGLPAKLVPGKTWIHIVPTSPGLETVVSYTP